MKRLIISVCCIIAINGCANNGQKHSPAHVASHAQSHSHSDSHDKAKATARYSSDWGGGLGDYHHPVSTKNAKAQRAFDEGLICVYAFNHDEAIRCFQRALEHDPKLAMAHWGIALALGPNYNLPMEGDAEKRAYDSIQKAIELCKGGPQHEKDYINALAKRYSNGDGDRAKFDLAYRDAMKALMNKHPDDMDAATLFAESMMVLRPWQLWDKQGNPAEGTEELVAALERVLRRNPDHPGANHLYIHAIEASNHPERALEAAGRLPGLSPASGHLVHMPSHIYQRVGDYEAAGNSNVAAIEADEKYFKQVNPPDGAYNMMYYPHNIHFLSIARCFEGRWHEAIEAADKLVKYVSPHVEHMPMLEGFIPTDFLVMARFGQWDKVLKYPEPKRSTPTTHALWRFARGMAFASKGQLADAQREHQQLVSERKQIPEDAVFSMLNNAHNVLKIAENVLAARIASANNDVSQATELLRRAAADEDALNYTEPPDWLLPCHEMMGGIFLRAGRGQEAEQAFREDLKRNPRSGRSLFGLSQSLKMQKRDYEARLVEMQLENAWKKADIKLRVQDL